MGLYNIANLMETCLIFNKKSILKIKFGWEDTLKIYFYYVVFIADN